MQLPEITPTSRRWIAIIILIIGAALLWMGYRFDVSRDAYYDCRQSAMDDLHHAFAASMDEDPNPDAWVPQWAESFRAWDIRIEVCGEVSLFDPPEVPGESQAPPEG